MPTELRCHGYMAVKMDVRCICGQGPQIMSRPGPKSGTRSSKSSTFFNQNNACSSSCEGWGPVRRVLGKPPAGCAVNNTNLEALREQLPRCSVPSNSVKQYTLCTSLGPHVSLCADLRPHALPVFKLVVMSCRLVLQTGVADCSATLFLTD